MNDELIWDEAKRERNRRRHGLDFEDAPWVLDSPYRLDVQVLRNAEWRTQSIAYVVDVLAVLSLVHTERGGVIRIISFRRASIEEREVYYDWLEKDYVP